MNALDSTPEQSPQDIFNDGVDQTKCITGKFKMTWHLDSKINAIAIIPPQHGTDDTECIFPITFELSKEAHSLLKISPRAEFRLSLRGAEVQKLDGIQKLCNLPMRLGFSFGVHIQWRHEDKELTTLNTWEVIEPLTEPDSWYGSPQKGEEKPAVPAQLHNKRNYEQLEESIQAGRTTEGHEVSVQDNRPSKAEQKRRRLEAKEAKRNKTAVISSPPTPAHPVCEKADIMEFKAGFRAGSDTYLAIKDVRPMQSAHLIGVVTDMSSPLRTRNGDFMRFVHLVDPSNYNTGGSGMKINCFTKRHEVWLPHPTIGDVLIMRSIKIVEYYSALTGVGYHDQLRWAAFSPSSGSIHHGPLNDAPRQEGLAEGGFGVTFSPFYQPGSPEIAYCIKLSDWWREVQKRDLLQPSKDNNSSTGYAATGYSKRIHRLISEAGPSVMPNGYFDCTIEVLKGWDNGYGRPHTLYVTDYTRNGDTCAVQSNWCPPSLSDFVLQMEMWDASAVRAQTMVPGEYYTIKNARMRINSSGYLEGKVADAKIQQLSEEDALADVHFKKLLERKQIWENKQSSSQHDIRYQLIQDIEEGKFFHCTVELLQSVRNAEKTSFIYVTDYTLHPHLTSPFVDEPWGRGLDGKIVKIFLLDEQRDMAEAAVVGSFYSIRKLRLKHSSVEGYFCGHLGGNERLIVALNPNNMGNVHLNGLLRRKELWERNTHALRQRAVLPTVVNKPIEDHLPTSESLIKQMYNNNSWTRIKDIPKQNIGPERYHILAKPVDFYPLDFEDAFYQFCSRCKIEIPLTKKACFQCNDFEHDHLRFMYQLYLRVEDEERNQIAVSINDESSLLDGLKRSNIHEDAQNFHNYRSRLAPLLGNLLMVHQALKANKTVEVDTPLCVFDLDSWIVSTGERAFSLRKYEIYNRSQSDT